MTPALFLGVPVVIRLFCSPILSLIIQSHSYLMRCSKFKREVCDTGAGPGSQDPEAFGEEKALCSLLSAAWGILLIVSS